VDAHAAEGSDLPELFTENLAGRFVEETLTVHDAGDAVVDGRGGLGGDFDSGFAHNGQENRRVRISNLRSHY